VKTAIHTQNSHYKHSLKYFTRAIHSSTPFTSNPSVTTAMASRFGSSFTKAVKAIKSLDVQHGKPVVAIVDRRKTVVPILMASMLFFTWGLTYGMLDVMNVRSQPQP
jgi:hypothetical protein